MQSQPSPKFTIILNPHADQGRTGQKQSKLEDILHTAGLDYDLVVTDGPNHAIALAKAAIDAGRIPVAAGGDGTISEVVNGVMSADGSKRIGILPLGTANDLIDMLDIPRDLDTAVKVLRQGQTRKIDLGYVNGRYFDNNSAVGLEPQVNLMNIAMPAFLKGDIRYIVATIVTILRKPAWQAEIIWDDGHYEGSLILASIGNTKRTGGAFFMTPNAEPDDGLLDFVFGPALPRLELIKLMIKVMKGTHLEDPRVHYHRTKTLTIRTTPGTPAHADGEIIETEAREVVWEVMPGAIEVFVKGEK